MFSISFWLVFAIVALVSATADTLLFSVLFVAADNEYFVGCGGDVVGDGFRWIVADVAVAAAATAATVTAVVLVGVFGIIVDDVINFDDVELLTFLFSFLLVVLLLLPLLILVVVAVEFIIKDLRKFVAFCKKKIN